MRSHLSLAVGALVALAGPGAAPLARAAVGTLADSSGVAVGWGDNFFGQITIPTGSYAAVAAGGSNSLGLRSDGTLAGWGYNGDGQTLVPGGVFTALAVGSYHSLGLRSDGTLAGWGENGDGQTTVPGGAFTAVAAGRFHSLGLRGDGTLAGWGDNFYGQTTVPGGAFTAVAAGGDHSLALRARTDYDGDLLISGSGLKANLNRSVHVAGNVTLASNDIRPFNNPIVVADGKIVIQPGMIFQGYTEGTVNATFQSHGLEVNDTGFAVRPEFKWLNTGPLSGVGSVTVSQSQLPVGMSSASALAGWLYTGPTASVVFTGSGYQEIGAYYAGADYINNFGGFHAVDAGGELRLGPGQRLRFASTTLTQSINQNGPSTFNANNYNGGKIELLGNAAAASEIEFTGSLHNAASTGLITGQSSTMRFTGGLDNRGAVALTAGLNNVSGDITNNTGGKIDVTGGASAVFYDDVVQNGTLSVRRVGLTNSTAVFLGSFTGSGGSSGGGDIFFDGDLRPGNSPASVTFANNVGFGDGAVTHIELAGTTPGTQYDRINVTGALALDGDLSVSLLGGFTPAAGNAFDILDWGSLSGTFDAITLPTLATNLAWNTSQLYTTGALSIGYAGDFNLNGVVDGADFLILQRGGSPTPNSASDLALWRGNFGATSLVATSVAAPEPHAAGMMLASALLLPLARRRAVRGCELGT
jgi:hypothetical protein